MLKDYSFRSGTSDSPICECGSGKETSEHYLFDCCRYRKQREELLNQLLQLRDKNHKILDISANLLLAPHLDISKCCSRIIKELLFEFISGTSRALQTVIFLPLPWSHPLSGVLHEFSQQCFSANPLRMFTPVLSVQRWNLAHQRPW